MRLHGYVNPTGRYPSVVVPVWMGDDGQLVAAYLTFSESGSERRYELRAVHAPDVVVLPSTWSDSTIEGLDPLDVTLIALNATGIIAFSVASEAKMIAALLADPSFASDQPFTRLAFARLSGSIHLVATELLSTATYLLTEEIGRQDGPRARVERWLQHERARLAETLGASDEASRFLAEMPTTVRELGILAWWRGHTAVLSPSKPLTLLEIEDRRTSPKTAAVLTIEPVVPDKSILKVMGRHISNGTNYLFFHDPSASVDALERLRDAALTAVTQAKAAARGPLSRLVTPTIGDVQFFSLAERWTGSPYVFYEDTVEGGTTVAGYRGLDIGAAIARSYEKLPDAIAFEILEALTSGAPKPVAFGTKHPDQDALNFTAALQRKQGS